MHRRMSTSVLVAVVILLLVSLPAPAATTIQFWTQFAANSTTARGWEALIADFEQANPDYKVELVIQESYDKIKLALATGIAPDIMNWTFTRNWEIDGFLSPLHDVFAQAGVREDDFFGMSYFRPYVTSGGQIIYSHMMGSVVGLFYNKDKFAEYGLADRAPATYAELELMARRLTKKVDSVTEQIGFALDTSISGGAAFRDQMWSRGGAFSRNGQLTVNSPETIATINFFTHGTAEGYLNALGSWSNFMAGTAAITSTSDSNIETALKANINLGTAALPIDKTPYTTYGGHGLVIPKMAANIEAARYFLSYILNPRVALKFYLASGFLPSRRSVVATREYQTFLAGSPYRRPFMEALQYVRLPEDIRIEQLYWTDFRNWLVAGYREVIGNTLSPQALAIRLEEQLRAALTP